MSRTVTVDDDAPEEELPDDWTAPPSAAELIIAEGRWLYFACYSLLVHSEILERGGTPRRKIPETPGALCDYAEELLAYVKKTGRVKGPSILDAETVERRVAMVRWILAGCPEDEPTAATPSQE